jgi:hypothetical protein
MPTAFRRLKGRRPLKPLPTITTIKKDYWASKRTDAVVRKNAQARMIRSVLPSRGKRSGAMLKKLSLKEAKQYTDFAYGLALDAKTSSYPSFRDGVKSKDDFMRAVSAIETNKNEEVLLYPRYGVPTGWIQWYFLEDGGSANTYTFLAKGNYREMLGEFLEYIASRKRFRINEIGIGVPQENNGACGALESFGFKLVEVSYVTLLKKEDFKPTGKSGNIKKIGLSDFAPFERLHKNVDMYWTAERIKEDIENWDVFFYDDGVDRGAIYTLKNGRINEISGIDYSCGAYAEKIGSALVNYSVLMDSNPSMRFLYYFVDGKDEAVNLGKLGFECVDRYRYYEKKLG